MTVSATTNSNSDNPLLDMNEAIDNLGGDTDLYREIVGVFLGDAPAQLSAVETALAAGDFPTARRGAHTLKGTSAAIGATRLRAAAFALESACAAAAVESIATPLAAVKRDTAATVAALQDYLANSA